MPSRVHSNGSIDLGLARDSGERIMYLFNQGDSLGCNLGMENLVEH
jgi:hypothetical protein